MNSQLVVGRFDGPDGGNGVGTGDPAAFAIHVDPTTGVVTVVQYVSIKHDDINDHDEANDDGSALNDAIPVDDAAVQQWINNNALRITATVTDGDGDERRSQQFNIGNKIIFQDDGPSATQHSVPGHTTAGGFVTADPIDDENQSVDIPAGSPGIIGGPGDEGFGTVTQGSLDINFGVDGPAITPANNPVVISQSVTVFNELGIQLGGPLKAIYVDADGNGEPRDVSLSWVANPAGGGTSHRHGDRRRHGLHAGDQRQR